VPDRRALSRVSGITEVSRLGEDAAAMNISRAAG
jgi:hypothetical protein